MTLEIEVLIGICLFLLALLLVFIIAVALDGGNNQRDNP